MINIIFVIVIMTIIMITIMIIMIFMLIITIIPLHNLSEKQTALVSGQNLECSDCPLSGLEEFCSKLY